MISKELVLALLAFDMIFVPTIANAATTNFCAVAYCNKGYYATGDTTVNGKQYSTTCVRCPKVDSNNYGDTLGPYNTEITGCYATPFIDYTDSTGTFRFVDVACFYSK